MADNKGGPEVIATVLMFFLTIPIAGVCFGLAYRLFMWSAGMN